MSALEIKRRIEHAKTLDFGIIFNDAIQLFKKVWVQGLVTLLLNMVLAIPVLMLVYIPLIITGLMDGYASSINTYDAYSQPEISPWVLILMALLYLVAIAAMGIIGVGLKASFYRICKLKDLEQMGKEDYFYFFKKPYFSKTVTLGFAYLGITLLATLLCFIPLIYAIVPLSYMFVIYAFNPEKSVSEIIKLSFSLGNKKWLISFGLFVVSGLLAGIVGMLMCFVGIYVTSSFNYLPAYLIYKEVVGFKAEAEDNITVEDVKF